MSSSMPIPSTRGFWATAPSRRPIRPRSAKMLVDDDVAHQAQPRHHVEVADPVRLLAGAFDQHGFAHDRRARRGARHQAAAKVQFPHHLLDRRVADLARYAQLVAAAEEDAGGVGEDVGGSRLQGFAPLMDIELHELVHSQLAESLLIGVEIAFGLVAGDGCDDELASSQSLGDRVGYACRLPCPHDRR